MEDLGRYRKIYCVIHADRKFNQLSKPQPNGQTLFQYLLTGPHTGVIPGLCSIGEAALAESLRWPLDAFRDAIAEAINLGLVKADWEARVLWIPNAIKYNLPGSINVIRSWGKVWKEIPDCALKVEAYQRLKAFIDGMGDAFQDAFKDAIPDAIAYPVSGAGAVTGTGTEAGLFSSAPCENGKVNQSDIEGIFSFYPKKTDRREAAKEIKAAILRERKRGGRNVVEGLKEKVKLFAKLTEGANMQFVKSCANWMKKECYRDDPATWKFIGRDKNEAESNEPIEQPLKGRPTSRVYHG